MFSQYSDVHHHDRIFKHSIVSPVAKGLIQTGRNIQRTNNQIYYYKQGLYLADINPLKMGKSL